ncbi:MAG: histidine--tRNA ligase [Acidobacteria bacterium]|nr:histidine--tRNA ligase [Acidobacteriota bacterium]
MTNNKIEPRLLKGFRDILPEDMLLRNEVIKRIRTVFEAHGFLPLETPALEHLDILAGKYGEEGDRLIYKFKDQGERDVALRYDLTVPLARVVAQYQELPKPFKRYQIQPVWRADKPQKGRFREFYQCDVDILGSQSITAEAEILSVVNSSLLNLGFDEFVIRINHRNLLNSILIFSGLGEDALIPVCRSIDKLDKIGPNGVKEELKKSGFSNEHIESIFKLIERKFSSNRDYLDSLKKDLGGIQEAVLALEEMSTLDSYMQAIGIYEKRYQFDISLARGLDYYTGMVFETEISRPKVGSITGGGRYDKLVGMFLKDDIAAVGTSLGLERIIEAVKEFNLVQVPPNSTSVMITNFGNNENLEAFKLLARLRNGGINAELYPDNVKMGKQLKYADKVGIPFVVILGEEEISEGKVKIKKFPEGDQDEISISGLVSYFKENLKDR